MILILIIISSSWQLMGAATALFLKTNDYPLIGVIATCELLLSDTQHETNTFQNMDKYILKLRQIHFPFLQIHFAIETIHFQSRQIHFAIHTNCFWKQIIIRWLEWLRALAIRHPTWEEEMINRPLATLEAPLLWSSEMGLALRAYFPETQSPSYI